jgi:hypothetical protein
MHPMKKLIIFLALSIAAAAGRAALPQPDLIAQIHFLGAQKILNATNSAAFTNEFCSAEALALRAQTADKLSGWLAGWLQQNVGAAVPAGALKLRPVLDDLQTAEWFLEARAAADTKAEVAVVIKLEPGRAAIWQAVLKPFFPAATIKQSGVWTVFESGTGTQKLADGIKISASDAAWLSLDVNWPRLAQWYPELKELGLPETQFHVTAADANLHINGKFFFPQNLALDLENWRLPTNTLHQPFISFTAVRGFASWLAGQSWAAPFQISPVPNQIFFWALPQAPFQTFAALPVPDSMNALAQVDARLKPIFNSASSQSNSLMPLTVDMTNNEVSLIGMPMMMPYLDAMKEATGPFLFAGAFPNSPRSKPLPPELFQRLAEKNLVLYHWEITAERWPQVLQLSQLGLLVSWHKQLEGESAAFKWMQKIVPALGNTDTEITQTAPDQMAFSRKAPGGLTAVELFALANWLEATNFPGCDLRLPPRPAKMKRPHAAVPAAPTGLIQK